jgi:hypothetical protein
MPSGNGSAGQSNPANGSHLPEEKKMNEQWRLPTKDELNVMYVQLHQKGLGNFAYGFYWSSSEVSSNDAWLQSFGDGDQYDGDKVDSLRIRLVRDLPEIRDYQNRFVVSLDDKHLEVAEKDEPGNTTWYDAIKKYGVPRDDNDLEAVIADRDKWRCKAEMFRNLLALVEDNIKDAYCLSMVREAIRWYSQGGDANE